MGESDRIITDETAFLAKEIEILDGMQQRGEKAIAENGLISKLPDAGKYQTGYFLYFPHGVQVAYHVHYFNSQLSKRLPKLEIVPYGVNLANSGKGGFQDNNVHTSLGTYDVSIDEHRKIDANIASKLAEATLEGIMVFTKEVREGKRKIPSITFKNFMHDESTILLRPVDKSAGDYLALGDYISNSAITKGIALKRAPMRHATAGRFTRELSKKETNAFNEFMRDDDNHRWYGDASAGFTTSNDLNSVGVGFFSLDGKPKRNKPYKSEFKIKPIAIYNLEHFI